MENILEGWRTRARAAIYETSITLPSMVGPRSVIRTIMGPFTCGKNHNYAIEVKWSRNALTYLNHSIAMKRSVMRNCIGNDVNK